MATGLPLSKTLVKYNSNNLEENEEEKEPIDIELTKEKKADPYNDENAFKFKWSGVQEDEEDIALANFNESLKKQFDKEIFPKKVTRWLLYRI